MTRAMSAPAARTHAAVAEKTEPALRASVPGLSGRSSRNANDLQTSLEEAEVRRPGREAGKLTRSKSRAPKVRHKNHGSGPERGSFFHSSDASPGDEDVADHRALEVASKDVHSI